MAKEETKVKKGAHVKAKDSTGKVTVADLAKEFDKDPKIIRTAIRAAGLRAPELPREEGTFGPKAKYEWEPGSKDLDQVYDAVETYLDDLETKEKERKANGGRTNAQLAADAKLKEMAEARNKKAKEEDDEDEDEEGDEAEEKAKSKKKAKK